MVLARCGNLCRSVADGDAADGCVIVASLFAEGYYHASHLVIQGQADAALASRKANVRLLRRIQQFLIAVVFLI